MPNPPEPSEPMNKEVFVDHFGEESWLTLDEVEDLLKESIGFSLQGLADQNPASIPRYIVAYRLGMVDIVRGWTMISKGEVSLEPHAAASVDFADEVFEKGWNSELEIAQDVRKYSIDDNLTAFMDYLIECDDIEIELTDIQWEEDTFDLVLNPTFSFRDMGMEMV